MDVDLVGQTIDLGLHNKFNVALVLPSDIDMSLAGGEMRPHAAGYLSMLRHGKPAGVSVKRFTLRADGRTPKDNLAKKTPESSWTPVEDKELERIRGEAATAAEQALRSFLDLVSLHLRWFDTTFSGPIDPNMSVVFFGANVDATANRFGLGGVTTPWPRREGLDLTLATAIGSRVANGEAPRLAQRLYLQARRELFIEADARYAVLLAATAAEVGMEQAILRMTSDSVVSLLLRHATFPMLLNAGVTQALGESFQKVDKQNHKRVDDLHKARNRILHEGADPPQRAQVEEWLSALDALLTWLDAKAP